MPTESEPKIYEINIEYTDAGLRMAFDMDEWLEKIERDFRSFDAIKEFYRSTPKEFIDRLTDGLKEIGPDETRDEPGIVLTNPPKEWKENPRQAAEFIEIAHRIMMEMGLNLLIEDEIEEEEKLLKNNLYKPLIVRQSAFYEEFLTFRSLLKFQELKEDILSSTELDVIEQMRHRDRLRLAHLFGVIDEEDHALLQEMATWRNRIAHKAWPEFDSQEESQIGSVGERVHTLLKGELKQDEEYMEENKVKPIEGEFDIGFEGLEVDLQNLQLGVLNLLRTRDDSAMLSDVQKVLTEDNETIEQRCYRMDHIGYLEIEDEELSLTQMGKELLREYWD